VKGISGWGLGVLAALFLAFALPPARAAGQLTVAAAADTQFAMRELAKQFEQKSGTPVRLVIGSSGNLTTQIEHGAPFDLFFSADVEHPEKLAREGLAAPGTLTRYAVGRLVVFVPAESRLDLEHRGLAALEAAAVKKIAIANPRFAPYGRAAVAALRHAGLYEKLEPKLVLGEDVAQTTQFVVSGNAQAGLTALALMLAPGRRPAGRWWVVPLDAYPPLAQAAVIVERSHEQKAARAFLQFLGTPEARGILQRYGFAEPGEKKR
jgi:molybdate transport system substrate-binding protein